MKKTLRMILGMLAIVALAMPMASCSDDNSDNEFEVKNLYGSWVRTMTTGVGENQQDITYYYVFNEDNTGYMQRVISAAGEEEDDVADTPFTYTVSATNPISGVTTLTMAGAGQDPQTVTVSIENGTLYLDRNAFERADVKKEIVGTWTAEFVEDNEVITVTYEFKKDGTGVATQDVYDKESGNTKTTSYNFTYVMTGENSNGWRVLIQAKDGKDENSIIFNVKIEDKTLNIDGDIYTKK